MRIEKMSQNGAGAVRVTLDDGRALDVTDAQASGLGLHADMELDAGRCAELERAAESARARGRALRALNGRDMSKRELLGKLARAGVDGELAGETADRLEELGLLNDAGYAASVVRHYAARGYGAGRVRDELYRRGIERELWDGALAELPDMEDAAYGFLKSRMRGADADGPEARRATAAMRRRGYGWDEMSRARDRYKESYEGAD
jgi:regulatory protein